MNKFIFFIVVWLPTFIWMGLIYYLSSFHNLTASPVGWQDLVIRKTAHFLEYTALVILFYRSFRLNTKMGIKEVVILSILLTILYAASDELHQTFVTGRSGKIIDILIDSSGAIIGFAVFWRLKKYLPKFLNKIIN